MTRTMQNPQDQFEEEKSSGKVEFQAQGSAIFPRVDAGINFQVKRDLQGSGSQIQLFQPQSQMQTMALELRRLHSDLAVLGQSLIEME